MKVTEVAFSGVEVFTGCCVIAREAPVGSAIELNIVLFSGTSVAAAFVPVADCMATWT